MKIKNDALKRRKLAKKRDKRTRIATEDATRFNASRYFVPQPSRFSYNLNHVQVAPMTSMPVFTDLAYAINFDDSVGGDE